MGVLEIEGQPKNKKRSTDDSIDSRDSFKGMKPYDEIDAKTINKGRLWPTFLTIISYMLSE